MCENLFYGEFSHFLSHTELDAYQTLRGSSTNKKHVTHDQKKKVKFIFNNWNWKRGKSEKEGEREELVDLSVVLRCVHIKNLHSSSALLLPPSSLLFFPCWEYFRLIFTRQTFDWRVVLYPGTEVVGEKKVKKSNLFFTLIVVVSSSLFCCHSSNSSIKANILWRRIMQVKQEMISKKSCFSVVITIEKSW